MSKKDFVIRWLTYYMNVASKDKNPASRNGRMMAYRRVISKINELANVNEQSISKMDITPFMMNRLMTILKNNKEPELSQSNTHVHGIGNVRANELKQKGIDVNNINDTNVDDIADKLPLETQVYLKYKPVTAIPHNTITKIKQKIEAELNLAEPLLTFAGSYRRKKPTSRDIDIIADSSVFKKVSDILEVKFADGPDKVAGLYKYGKIYVKMDIMRTTKVEYPFFLLYLTGSREHNIIMRKRAKDAGYLLNQRGLFKITESSVSPMRAKTEEDIFRLLKMTYVTPEKRL